MGVSIPDAYDYGRVVPQSQTAVNGYRVADAAVASDAGGRALVQVGQDLKGIAADTEKWSLSLDSTMAQAALNRIREARSNLTVGEDGFAKVRGGDVLNKKDSAGNTIFDSYPQRLQTQVDDITANSNLSPRARLMLANHAQTEMLGFKSDISRHGLSETEKYQAAVFVNNKSILTDRAVQNANEAVAFEKGLSDIQSAVRVRAAQLGVPSEAMEKAAVSDVVKFSIMNKIASGDSSALGFYDRYKDRLDPKDSQAIEQSIKTMRTQTDARAWVASNSAMPTSAEMKKRVADGIDFWEQAGYGRHVGAGIIANFLHESGFRTDNPNPRDGADGSDSIGIAHWNSDRAEALKRFIAANGGDRNNVNTQLRFAQSEIDANPALKAKLMAAKTAAEAAEIFTREFEKPKDPHLRAAERAVTANKILAENPGRAASTGDQALDAVNAATGSAPSTAAPVSPNADGIVNARQMMIDIERRKLDLTNKAQTEFANNLPQLQATLHQIEANYTRQKAGVQLYKDQLYNSVQDWMTKGGPGGGPAVEIPPANIFSQLTWEQQQSIERQVQRNIEGKKAVTNQQVWYNIHSGLTSDNANVREMWANIPLFQFKEFLSDQDFQELAKTQGAVRKGDENAQGHSAMVNEVIRDTLLASKIDPTPKPDKSPDSDAGKVARFHREFFSELAIFEAQKGKKATRHEVEGIVDGLMKTAVKGGWFSSDRPVYQVQTSDIPEATRLEIISAIRKSGGVPTEERVLRMYRHGLAMQPREEEIPRPLEPPMLGIPESGRPARPSPAAPPGPIGGNRFGGNRFGGQTFGGQTFGGSTGEDLRRQMGLE